MNTTPVQFARQIEPGLTHRILIVEDDAILVTHLEQTLIQIGYQVSGLAATGEAAIEMALAQKPDAILMDIQLRSAMTGIQAAAEIHRQLDTPIIYLTAYTDEELLQQAKLTDAYAYLTKPVRDRELRTSLEMALYKHATEKRLQHLNQILRAVRAVNQLITREPDAQRLLDQACQILLRAQGYRFVWVGQSMGDRLKPLAQAGEGQALITRIVTSATPEQGLRLPGTQAALTRRVVVCHDMLQDERYTPWRDVVEQVHFSSTVAVPILHEQSLFGVLSVYSDQTYIFGAEELDLLLELASDIAFGLKAIERESERQRAEEELLKFKLGIERSADAIFMTDPQGVILYTNPAFEQIYGYNQSDAIGQTPKILKSGVVLAKEYQQFWTMLLNKEIVAGEIINKTKDGRLVTIEGSNSPILDTAGNIIGFLGMHRDISERKRADERILQSEKKYRELFQVNQDGIAIFLLDPSGPPSTFVELNDAAPKMLGYTRAEMLKLTPMMLEPYTTQTQLQARNSEFDSQEVVNFETVLLHKDGHPVQVEFTAQMIQYENQPAIMNIARDISERKQHEIELQAIARLSAALRSAPSRVEILPVIVEQLVVLLNCETVAIEIIDPLTGEDVIEAAHGIWTTMTGTRQKSGTGINAIIRQTRKPYFANDLKNDPNLVYPEWARNDIRGCIGAPLIALDQLIGFIWMGRRSEIAEAEVRLVTAVADIAANALHRATMYEQSQKDAAELVLAYDSTLEGWAHALELRDQETEGHTRRVMQMTVELSKAMGVGEKEFENVRRGALLHDIGKMGVPDSVLLKPGTLNEREWEIMRRHPEYAKKFLEPIDYLRPVLDIPYCHHEKWDGTGYPRGLKGAEIPFVARIFAIVDVWDALTSDRPYRTAWTNEKTRQYILDQSGIHFDPQVVQVFMQLLDKNNDSIRPLLPQIGF